MTQNSTIKLPSFEEASLDNCNSMLICLDMRRFVVVRLDEPRDLWPIVGGWQRVRELNIGDEVIYKGCRTKVRAIDVYR